MTECEKYYLAHYGVLGMKWGVRRGRKAVRAQRKQFRKDIRAAETKDQKKAIRAKRKSLTGLVEPRASSGWILCSRTPQTFELTWKWGIPMRPRLVDPWQTRASALASLRLRQMLVRPLCELPRISCNRHKLQNGG